MQESVIHDHKCLLKMEKYQHPLTTILPPPDCPPNWPDHNGKSWFVIWFQLAFYCMKMFFCRKYLGNKKISSNRLPVLKRYAVRLLKLANCFEQKVDAMYHDFLKRISFQLCADIINIQSIQHTNLLIALLLPNFSRFLINIYFYFQSIVM